MRSPPLALAERAIGRAGRLGCGALLCALAAAAHAEPTALQQAQRISVWGVPVQADAATAADADGASERKPAVVRGVALEQSRWSDSAPRGAAVDRPALAGAARSGVEVTDVSYRWGLSSERGTMDVGVGAGTYRLQPGVDAAVGPGAGYGVDGRRDVTVPTLSVGVRHSLPGEHRIDVAASGSASLASAAVGEFYTAKVKVEWLPTKNSGIGFEQAAASMRFSPNSNLALRVRGGGAMLYYRSKF